MKFDKDSMYLEEYKLIQSKIDQYGNSSQQLKWFTITVTLALGTYSLKEGSLWAPVLGILGICIMLFYEGFNSIFQDILKNRAIRLENASKNDRCEKIGEPLQLGHILKDYKKEGINTFAIIVEKIKLHSMQNSVHFFSIFLMIIIIVFNSKSYVCKAEIFNSICDINTTISVSSQKNIDSQNNTKLHKRLIEEIEIAMDKFECAKKTSLQTISKQAEIVEKINGITATLLSMNEQRDKDIEKKIELYNKLKEKIEKRLNKTNNTTFLSQRGYIYVQEK